MNDTVPAATAFAPDDARLSFLGPTDNGLTDDSGTLHVSGASFGADDAPSLLISFTTFSPDTMGTDAFGWVPAVGMDQTSAASDQAPPTISGYAATTPDDAQSMFIAPFDFD